MELRYKDRSDKVEDGNIVMFDKVNKIEKILIKNIGCRVNDMKLCVKDNILYIACKGLYKLDLNNN